MNCPKNHKLWNLYTLNPAQKLADYKYCKKCNKIYKTQTKIQEIQT